MSNPFSKLRSRYLEFFTLELLIATLFCLLSIFLFAMLVDETLVEKENYLDERAFALMRSITSAPNTTIALIITFFGTGTFLIPAYLLIVFYFLKKRKPHYAILIAVIALVSMLSGWAFKEIFHRERPLLPMISGAGGYSFPSGHSLGGFTFSGVIIYLAWVSDILLWKKWVISLLALLFGLLIGLSRIYLHVHFASDVIGSLFITIVWLSLSFITLRVLEKKLSKDRFCE